MDSMDRQLPLEVEGVMGEVLTIDWRDKDGGWTEFMRIKVKMDMLKPLRRVVYVVGSDRVRISCVIKYKRLHVFCYICGCIGHKLKKCDLFSMALDPREFQYGNWLRVQVPQSGQSGGRM